jgi:uncharacterized coiled-coil DUF342 family protein
MSDINWRDATDEYKNLQPQETTVTEQENPAVSKLREAFDAAKNAIVEGTELAKLVTELRGQVNSLQLEVGRFQRDMEYLRDRNKELDEQVTQVRRQRDEAIADASEQRGKVLGMEAKIDAIAKERDDAMVMALEYESKLKAAEAKLATIEALFGSGAGQGNAKPEAKPVPHYVDQPRDEVGKFQPTTYDRGSQSEGSGF